MSTTRSDPRSTAVPRFLADLVDDAAIFPPGDAAMTDAVPAHAAYRQAWYADLVGPFVCSDQRLPELQGALDRPGAPDTLVVAVTVTGGAGALEPALTWVQRDPRLELAAVEITLRDEADLARNVGRVDTVLAGCLPNGADAYLEFPRLFGTDVLAGWARALDELAATGYRLKYRTGGLDPEAFPSAGELAVVIDAALEREVELKCTAGLHHAVAHTDDATGFDHHGFLNVLLATRAALDGAAPSEIEAVLAERDPDTVAGQIQEQGTERLVAARRWFRSFGSCSILEPVEDLLALELVERPADADNHEGAT